MSYRPPPFGVYFAASDDLRSVDRFLRRVLFVVAVFVFLGIGWQALKAPPPPKRPSPDVTTDQPLPYHYTTKHPNR